MDNLNYLNPIYTLNNNTQNSNSSSGNLGNILFVSTGGNDDQTREQTLGNINSPLATPQAAIDRAIDKDFIYIFSGDYGTFEIYGFNGTINIYIENARIETILITDCINAIINIYGSNQAIINLISLNQACRYISLININILNSAVNIISYETPAYIKDCIINIFDYHTDFNLSINFYNSKLTLLYSGANSLYFQDCDITFAQQIPESSITIIIKCLRCNIIQSAVYLVSSSTFEIKVYFDNCKIVVYECQFVDNSINQCVLNINYCTLQFANIYLQYPIGVFIANFNIINAPITDVSHPIDIQNYNVLSPL